MNSSAIYTPTLEIDMGGARRLTAMHFAVPVSAVKDVTDDEIADFLFSRCYGMKTVNGRDSQAVYDAVKTKIFAALRA